MIKSYTSKALHFLMVGFLIGGTFTASGQIVIPNPPWSCTDGMVFLLREPDVFIRNTVWISEYYPLTGRFGSRKSIQTSSTLAFNPQNNYLYASISGTNSISKIGSNDQYSSDIYGVNGLPSGTYDASAFDNVGNLYLRRTGTSRIWKIAISPADGRPTGVTQISLSMEANLKDIVVNADGSKIYGIDSSTGNLITYSVSGNVATGTSKDVGLVADDYAIFLDKSGSLFAFSTFNTVYQMRPDYDQPVAMTIKLGGDGFPQNFDVAMCPSASIYGTAQPNFPRDGLNGYVLESAGFCAVSPNENIYSVNFAGEYTLRGQHITNGVPRGTLNAMGYNDKDGYFWAVRTGSDELVRIGSDWTVRYFPVERLKDQSRSLCTDALIAGDIDKNGKMYLMTEGKVIYTVDLDPASPTYLTMVGSVPVTGLRTQDEFTDFAFNPVDQLLYTVTPRYNLIRINPETGVAANLGRIGTNFNLPFVTPESIFFNEDGDLFFHLNQEPDFRHFLVIKNAKTNLVATDLGVSNKKTTFGDAASSVQPSPPAAIYGWLFHDLDLDGRGDHEPFMGTDDPNQTMNVYITDGEGVIRAKCRVRTSDGYFEGSVRYGNYTATLSNKGDLAVGSKVAIPASLPTTWTSTGCYQLFLGNAFALNAYSFQISAFGTVGFLYFGIQKAPVAIDKSYVLTGNPKPGDAITLNGTWPGAQSPDECEATDQEKGRFDGHAPKDPEYYFSQLGITSLPVAIDGTPPGRGPELYYDGRLITSPEYITNKYDRNKLVLKLNGTGYKGIEFKYQFYDHYSHSNIATYRITWPTPLPVKLVSFDARIEGQTALLGWATSEETNSDHFEVQRSNDAKSWDAIGVIKSVEESSIRSNYSFTDQSPVPGINYYRLKMVDADSSSAYSRIENVDFKSEIQFLYPNPTSDKLFIEESLLETVTMVSIRNVAGVKVRQTSFFRDGIDIRDLPAGVYTIMLLKQSGLSETHKVVLE